MQSGCSAGKRLVPGCVSCSLCVEAAFSLGFMCIQEVHNVASGDEEHRNYDQDAKVLWLRSRDHHNEVKQVHQVVHRTLHSIHHASL